MNLRFMFKTDLSRLLSHMFLSVGHIILGQFITVNLPSVPLLSTHCGRAKVDAKTKTESLLMAHWLFIDIATIAALVLWP